MRVVRWVGIALASYVGLALTLDGMIAAFQPQSGRTGVLRTVDAEGNSHDTVLSILDDGETLWVESGHHFRGWYNRVRSNPEVELIREGETVAYRAVALDTAEAREHVIGLMKEGAGSFGYGASRVMLLFAPIKPVRLDPRDH